MKALVESLNQNVATLMDAHKKAQDGLLQAVTKPKTTKAKAVKNADGSWNLIKEEINE